MSELARQIEKQFPRKWSSRRRKWHTALAEALHHRGFDPITAVHAARMALSDARIRFGDKDYDWSRHSIQTFAEELSRDD